MLCPTSLPTDGSGDMLRLIRTVPTRDITHNRSCSPLQFARTRVINVLLSILAVRQVNLLQISSSKHGLDFSVPAASHSTTWVLDRG